jgi:hypothetical protein
VGSDFHHQPVGLAQNGALVCLLTHAGAHFTLTALRVVMRR